MLGMQRIGLLGSIASGMPENTQLAVVQSALDALPANIAILDQRGEIVGVNARWVEYAEQNSLTQQSYGIGQNYLDICKPAAAAEDMDAIRVSGGLRDILSGRLKKEFTHEYLCPHPSDSSCDRWFELWLIPFAIGSKLYVLVSHQDVTDRRSLERTSRLLMAAISQSRSGIMITNVSGDIEYVNHGFERLTGYLAHEVLGRKPSLLKSGRISQETYEDLWQTICAGETWRGQVCNRRKDASDYWEEMTISPVKDDLGEITHYVAVKEDINDSRSMELLHAGIINASADIFVVLDDEFRILEWGYQAKKILGRSAEDVIGQDFLQVVFCSECSAGAYSELSAFRRDELLRLIGCAHRTEMRHADGHMVTVELWLASLSLQGEKRYAGFIRDLTENVRAEQVLLEAQKMEGLGQMAGGFAHDFNNLLHIIIGSLRLASAGPPEKAYRHIENALTAAGHGAALVSSLASFVRRGECKVLESDVHGLIRSLEALIRQILGKSVQLEFDLQALSSTALIDANAFNNALVNLAVNARDAMPSGGLMCIATRNSQETPAQTSGIPASNFIVVSVSDNGHGMSPEVVAKATEAFFTTKPPGKGTGLGLSMVNGFCQQSGGSLNIYSDSGKGCVLELVLPAFRSQVTS